MQQIKSSSIVCDLQHIVDTAHSISSVICFPAHAHTFEPEPSHEDFSLPPPPPIDNALARLGVSSVSFARLVGAYNHSASQFQHLSERKLRRAIQACTRITLQSGLPAYDSHLIRMAATAFYMQAVRAMQTIVISLYEESVSEARRSSLFANVPRTLSPRIASRPGADVPAYRKVSQHVDRGFSRPDDRNRVHRHKMPKSSPDTPPSLLFRGASKLQSFFDLSKGHVVEPVYKAGAIVQKDINVQEGTSHTYPHRYTHIPSVSTSAFPTGSGDFFPEPHSRDGQRLASREADNMTDCLLARFSSMRLASHESQVQRSGGAHRSSGSDSYGLSFLAPSGSAPMAKSREKTLDLERSDSMISLDVPTFKASSQGLRRKCSPLPNRRPSLSLATSDNTESGTSPTPLKIQLTSTSCTPAVALHSVAGNLFPAPSASGSGPRRRKVAPLPRRQPIAPSCSSPFPTFTPSRKGDCSQSPSPSLDFIQQRPSLSISRTPSLASLSSSRPDSPNTTDDGLDTPPSSPCAVNFADYKSTGNRSPSLNSASLFSMPSPQILRSAVSGGGWSLLAGRGRPNNIFGRDD